MSSNTTTLLYSYHHQYTFFEPTYNTLTSMHFYSWKKGLKTGIYYLRRKAKHQPQQFTIVPEQKETEEKDEIYEMCSD